jgi:hypothetical protein
VANKTISNSLMDLEATIEGLGRPQGSAAWVPVERGVGKREPSPNGEGKKWAEVGPKET